MGIFEGKVEKGIVIIEIEVEVFRGNKRRQRQT